jgi:hypothetical protein
MIDHGVHDHHDDDEGEEHGKRHGLTGLLMVALRPPATLPGFDILWFVYVFYWVLEVAIENL